MVWSIPAADTVGGASRVIVISSVDGEHTPLLIVQRNVLMPTLNPVTPDVGDVGVVTTPVPAKTVQTPVPTTGVFPASVAVVEHTVWFGPAAESVGKLKRKIVTESNDAAHVPLEMVQTKIFVPTPNPVSPDVGEVGVVMVALPATMVQSPVPTTGVFPASVVLVAQMV